ncbi:MAG: hypothetical protein A2233_04890 [Candidatus Kerfeldbacteria bacterium RIFOXYA2_FULL_38_24]|uniref:EamA domain-containing protein n=1 Tax=Candidatus Kerfeldbacteria bacterium RIFOXYB2_FULL_38_14 TaxID=1798547 RepID=A0A1G2BI92_9BACT|nr:MAG: hypothetical protein A2319_02190 [Candidatus Kerfeldbacteria bacterium RIFOXYB2_FULL_38_14]OGY88207.1 MAG: hypothetical protein A2233_04890 [Candidatus Kerfeldbacteria bacterium RIFOXYA2_FULL_38_24]OGY90052.1 MAG: hypothetical protein A2458_00145 [Candidatus Kerfeldbacteria bacterium RIFOXYC2_FULL_38_9]
MIWLFFAILGPFVWAISNLIDDELADVEIKSPFALISTGGFFAVIPLVIFSFFGGLAWPGVTLVLLCAASSVVGISILYFYYKALTLTDPAHVLLMWNLAPVFTVILALIFLHVDLEIWHYLAVGILIFSSLIAAYKKGLRLSKNNALFWTLIASLFSGIEAIVNKSIFEQIDFPVAIVWMSLFSVLISLFFFISLRQVRKTYRHIIRSGIWKIMGLNELLDLGACLSIDYAVNLGPVVLVKAVEGIQPLFVIALGYLFVKREKKEMQFSLWQLIISALLAIIGLALIKEI